MSATSGKRKDGADRQRVLPKQKRPNLTAQSRFQRDLTRTSAEVDDAMQGDMLALRKEIHESTKMSQSTLKAINKLMANLNTWKDVGDKIRPRLRASIFAAPSVDPDVNACLALELSQEVIDNDAAMKKLRAEALAAVRDIRCHLRQYVRLAFEEALQKSANKSLDDFTSMSQAAAAKFLGTLIKDDYNVFALARRAMRAFGPKTRPAYVSAHMIFFVYEEIGRTWSKAKTPLTRSKVDKCRRWLLIAMLDKNGDRARIDDLLAQWPKDGTRNKPSAEAVAALKLPSWADLLAAAVLDRYILEDPKVQAAAIADLEEDKDESVDEE